MLCLRDGTPHNLPQEAELAGARKQFSVMATWRQARTEWAASKRPMVFASSKSLGDAG